MRIKTEIVAAGAALALAAPLAAIPQAASAQPYYGGPYHGGGYHGGGYHHGPGYGWRAREARREWRWRHGYRPYAYGPPAFYGHRPLHRPYGYRHHDWR